MMTAEQFWPEWAKETYPAICDTSLTGSMTLPFVFKFADAHAAAQLAEKERLYEDADKNFEEANARAEAAEERLKEAQAEIKRLQNLFAITGERSTS